MLSDEGWGVTAGDAVMAPPRRGAGGPRVAESLLESEEEGGDYNLEEEDLPRNRGGASGVEDDGGGVVPQEDVLADTDPVFPPGVATGDMMGIRGPSSRDEGDEGSSSSSPALLRRATSFVQLQDSFGSRSVLRRTEGRAVPVRSAAAPGDAEQSDSVDDENDDDEEFVEDPSYVGLHGARGSVSSLSLQDQIASGDGEGWKETVWLER